jgi:hypothetical protein
LNGQLTKSSKKDKIFDFVLGKSLNVVSLCIVKLPRIAILLPFNIRLTRFLKTKEMYKLGTVMKEKTLLINPLRGSRVNATLDKNDESV